MYNLFSQHESVVRLGFWCTGLLHWLCIAPRRNHVTCDSFVSTSCRLAWSVCCSMTKEFRRWCIARRWRPHHLPLMAKFGVVARPNVHGRRRTSPPEVIRPTRSFPLLIATPAPRKGESAPILQPECYRQEVGKLLVPVNFNFVGRCHN